MNGRRAQSPAPAVRRDSQKRQPDGSQRAMPQQVKRTQNFRYPYDGDAERDGGAKK
jgi:hypothetical protein